MTVLLRRRLNGGAYIISAALGGGNPTATLANSSLVDVRQVFNRTVYTGNPAAFSTAYGKGWALVPVIVTPSVGVSTGMWVRLHNALDVAAVAATPGTGAVLQPSVAVAGVTTLTTGANALNLTIPAAAAWYYADLALDAAMTNPVRIPVQFGVGMVAGGGPGTSHEYRLFTSGYLTGTNPDISTMVGGLSPYGVIYAPGDGDNSAGWMLPGNAPGAPFVSAGAAEYLNLLINKLGVVCALAGGSNNGGNTSEGMPGTIGGNWLGTVKSALTRNGANRWETQFIVQGNDLGLSTRGVYAKRLGMMLDTLQTYNTNASMGAILCFTPLAWGYANGSSVPRMHYVGTRDVERTRSNAISWNQSDSNGPGWSGHSSQQGRKRWAATAARYTAQLMGTAKGGIAAHRGPTVTSAVRSGVNIDVTVALEAGATALVVYAWTETDPQTGTDYLTVDPTTITPQMLRALVSVYPAGKAYYSAVKLALDSVTLTGATTFRVVLSSDPGASTMLDLYYMMDPDHSYIPDFAGGTSGGGCVAIKDNFDDGMGVGYGYDIQQTFDPIPVLAPSPATQAIVVSTPGATVAGAFIALSGGPGAGLPLTGAGSLDATSSVEVSVGGGAYAVPEFLLVKSDNSWSGFKRAPGTVAAGVTIAARRAGQISPDASTTVNIISASSSIAASVRASALVQWKSSNAASMWQDVARTIPAAQFQPVRAIDNTLSPGDGNTLTTISATDPNQAPYLDMRWRVFYGGVEAPAGRPQRDDLSLERPYLQFEGGTTTSGDGRVLFGKDLPFLSSLTGSYSILCVQYWTQIINAGSIMLYTPDDITGGAPNWVWTNGGGRCLTGIRLSGSGLMGGQRFGPNNALAVGAYPNTTGVGQGIIDFTMLTFDIATGILTITQQDGSTATATTTDLAATSFRVAMMGAAPNQISAAYKPIASTTGLMETTIYSRALSSTEIQDEFTRCRAEYPGSP